MYPRRLRRALFAVDALDVLGRCLSAREEPDRLCWSYEKYAGTVRTSAAHWLVLMVCCLASRVRHSHEIAARFPADPLSYGPPLPLSDPRPSGPSTIMPTAVSLASGDPTFPFQRSRTNPVGVSMGALASVGKGFLWICHRVFRLRVSITATAANGNLKTNGTPSASPPAP
jgi:hypothetical protein